MSLHPEPIGAIPAETARVARAAFPKGTLVTRLRDEFSVIYQDEDFGGLYPGQGQPALAPWRLALVTVFQFLENLSDRQAADAVRARIDWKYALGLELTDPGFHFSVLTEFRARLVAPRRALRGLGLCRCRSAGQQPAGLRRLARRAGAGHLEPAGARRTRLRPAALRNRLGPRAGHLPTGQDIGVLAPRAGRRRRDTHLCSVQPNRLQALCCQGPLRPGDGRPSRRSFSSA